jgi:hypothetical protein
MRSVLIAAVGTALLAAPAAGQTPEPVFKNFDQVTTCEVYGEVRNGTDTNPLATMRLFRGGLDADIAIEGVDPFFVGNRPPITLCEALAEQEIAKFCQKNNRKGRTAQDYAVLFSFKKAIENLNPPPPQCAGPDDPHCYDPFAMSFILDTFDAGLQSGACAEFL